MANGNSTDTPVKYVNKDFQSFKTDLINYAQAHFSGAYQDYNEASPGMMILELQAYIGDVLSFYQDQQFLEIRQNTARQLENIEAFAKMRGYKPKGLRSATVTLNWIVEVPASASTDGSGQLVPDPNYLPILVAGAQAAGPSGTVFETIEDLDFSMSTPDNPQQAVISKVVGGNTFFAVMRQVDAVAGATQTANITVGAYAPYNRLQIGDATIQEILSVYDGEGNRWFEVDFLAQNAVFDQVVNTTPDSGTVPYTLAYVTTGRRFVVDQSLASNTTYLQFGPGQGSTFDDELIPNVANLALPLEGRATFTNFILDPQNFLKTSSLGLSPFNTILTIRYRAGGGTVTNVPAKSINKPQATTLTFGKTIGLPGGLDPAKTDSVQGSITVANLIASAGGADAEGPSDIKANAASYFAAQGRCVTREDFVTHVLSMPSQFGAPARCYVRPNEFNPYGVDLHVLSVDPDGHFQKATTTLKQNIQTYLQNLRMITEGITILDVNVVDLDVNFGVVISPQYNRTEVLANCIIALQTYFVNDNMQVGMPLVQSDVEATLQAISGVISVYKLTFTLNYGAPYSADINFDIEANTKNGILYCPENTIFEVRFPANDIIGESK
jgi:hypothetical protein